MTKALVLDSNFSLYANYLTNNGFSLLEKNDKMKRADLVLFTGGSDVSPSLYGESKHPKTSPPDKIRDEREQQVFEYAKTRGIPMLGICRGAQFLHVMNGGILIQDVTGHAGPNHEVSLKNGQSFVVTSTHHQMMDPDTDGSVLAWSSPISSHYSFGDMEIDNIGPQEPEAIFYKKTKCLCIQWHPEYMNSNTDGYRFPIYWISNLLNK